MTDKTKFIKLAIVVFAVIGLLAVLGLGIWGTLRVSKTLPSPSGVISRLASIISGITLKKEEVEPASNVVADPKSVSSGGTFTLEWQAPKNGSVGIYELVYACGGAVTLKLQTGEEILCDAPFNLWSKVSTKLSATTKSDVPVELAISINFIAQGSNAPTKIGSANVIISPKEETPKAASVTPKTTTPTAGKEKISARVAGGVVPITSGPANLAIQIIDAGIINDATGVFSHATSVGVSQRAGIVFDVMNIGGVISQQWKFRAALPAAGGDYLSDTQDPIAAGAKIRYTIGFKDLAQAGDNTAAIIVDPLHQISDADRANNTASTTIVRGY